jgi:hypothetical protein
MVRELTVIASESEAIQLAVQAKAQLICCVLIIIII